MNRSPPCLIALTFILAALSALAAEPAQPYPLWDGHESIAEYAKRAGLKPTKTLDVGNGVKLELVLIPAGKFVMGTEEPKPVDEEGFHSKIMAGQVVLGTGGGALLVLLGVVVIRAIRKRQRPQYSLALFLGMVIAAGVCLLGGLHWRYSVRGFEEARAEYEAVLARYKAGNDGEKPAHEVTLSRPSYLGKFEITQEQYQQIMGNNPSRFKGRDLPVEQVSWDEAQGFCRKAGEKAGGGGRLPTEAEWEYACRAGTRTSFQTGETISTGQANYANFKGKRTVAVGSFEPNAFGLHDMHGNVSEWCWDMYDSYAGDAQRDPKGAVVGDARVVRGGCWYDFGSVLCRSAYRSFYRSDFKSSTIGFRIAVSVASSPLPLPPPVRDGV